MAVMRLISAWKGMGIVFGVLAEDTRKSTVAREDKC